MKRAKTLLFKRGGMGASDGGPMPDRMIRELSTVVGTMISPFEEGVKRPGVISYGLTHYGYDFRVADEFVVFPEWSASKLIDPKDMNPEGSGEHVKLGEARMSVYGRGWVLQLPPHSMALGHTVETFDIPEDVIAFAYGKSTYCRCGLILNMSPFEPGWKGQSTLCLVNPTVSTISVYANEGIGQLVFHLGYEVCSSPYNMKGGKYQDARGILGPTVDKEKT